MIYEIGQLVHKLKEFADSLSGTSEMLFFRMPLFIQNSIGFSDLILEVFRQCGIFMVVTMT